MTARFQLPDSWYQPPADDGPEEWTVACPTCEQEHRYTGDPIPCQCGHTITEAEALRARPEQEERE